MSSVSHKPAKSLMLVGFSGISVGFRVSLTMGILQIVEKIIQKDVFLSICCCRKGRQRAGLVRESVPKNLKDLSARLS